jgi:uncharacterized protein involved in outer membrane biogenesis
MRRLFRWLFRLLILAIVLLVALVLLKDILLKALAEHRIRQQTGLSVTIQKLEVGLLAPTFTLEGFKLFNPPEFGGSPLFDIREVHFEYDPLKAAAGKIHLRLLRFNLNEINLVRNQFGQTNVFAVLAHLNQPKAASPGASTSWTNRVEFGGIDRLYLSLGTVRFTDQARPSNGWTRTLGWKDYEIKNLQTAQDVNNWAMLLFLQAAVSPARSGPAGPGQR